MRVSRRQVLKLGVSAGSLMTFPWLVGCDRQPSRPLFRYSNWGGAGDDSDLARLQRELREEFARTHQVDVQYEPVPDSAEYVSKMLLSFIAGTEPDVMQLDASSAAAFIDNNTLLDLRPFIDADPDVSMDDFFPAVANMARRDEAIYTIPLDFTPMVMYLNLAHLRDAGIEPPTGQWSRDEFVEAARAMTSGSKYGYAFANWMPGWILWLWNGGGDVLDPTGSQARGTFDSLENIATVEWLHDIVVKNPIAPNLSQMAATGVDPFLSGSAAMTISGHWNMTLIPTATGIKPEDVFIAPLPYGPGTTASSTTVAYQSGLSIGRNCKQPELAWEYVKFNTSAHVQRQIQKTGLAVCARKDVATELAGDDRNENVFLRVTEQARVPWGATVKGYDYVETTGTKMMDGVLRSGLSASEALDKAAIDIDRYFEELQR